MNHLTEDVLVSVAAIAETLERGYRERLIAGRFERGLTAFMSGKRSEHIDEGLLCFQRSLEGILHPKDSKQFCKRAEKLISQASESSAVGQLLKAIYDARSGFTHAEALTSVFPGLSGAEARRRGRELQAATCHLAARSYLAILSDPKLVRLFSSEPLGEYWGRVVVGKERPPFTIALEPAEYTSDGDEEDPKGADG